MLFEKIQLEPDEKVLKMVRKHWFVITTELVTVGVIALAPLLLLAVFEGSTGMLSTIGIEVHQNPKLITFGITAWLLLSAFSGFTIWTHYYLDLWVITDRRIISVDQIHFFNRNVAIFRLERLQDIEFGINGLLPTFLNFGTISAQTAGHHDHNFKATGMPDPRALQGTIQSAMDQRLKTLHINPDESE